MVRASDFVRSLDRGLAIIRVFDADNPRLTLSQVARSVGINRASARRFLHTLRELGYVRIDGPHFELSPRVLHLGYAHLGNLRLPELATPHLERLGQLCGESSSLSVLDDAEIVYLARASTDRIMRVTISVGARLPAYATSMGRVLLAGQPDDWLDRYLATAKLEAKTPATITDTARLRRQLLSIRQLGYAIVDQELEEGLRSIAAPIRDGAGKVIAAINVSVHAGRGTVESMRERLLPPLIQTAAAIEDDLRNVPR
jgi:IclR family pca regulon transcriptional regulator